MNIRRLNANERYKGAVNLILFICIFILLLIPPTMDNGQKNNLRDVINKPEITNPLSDYTCEEIYQKIMDNENIYSNSKRHIKYTEQQIIIHYLKFCIWEEK
jgi:hypothetical protein